MCHPQCLTHSCGLVNNELQQPMLIHQREDVVVCHVSTVNQRREMISQQATTAGSLCIPSGVFPTVNKQLSDSTTQHHITDALLRHVQQLSLAEHTKGELREEPGQRGTTFTPAFLHGSTPPLTTKFTSSPGVGCINSRSPVSTQGALQRVRSCPNGRRCEVHTRVMSVMSLAQRPCPYSSKESRQHRGKVSDEAKPPANKTRFVKSRRCAAIYPKHWREPAARWFGLFFAPVPRYNDRFARQYRYEPPPEFPMNLPFSGIIHNLSGPDTYVLTHTTLKITVGCRYTYPSFHFHWVCRINTRKLAHMLDSLNCPCFTM